MAGGEVKAAPLKIDHAPTDSLIPYARNARTHSDAQVAQIAASIREFGWTNPILVDDESGVIAGHGRLLAARKLGMDAVPVIRLGGLTKAQRKALVIADNKLALSAGWDDEMLKLELSELQAMDFDISLTGFGDMELAGLLGATEGLTDEDDAPEPTAEPVTRTGDLWVLGRHRLLCGDSTSADDVGRLMPDPSADLLFTSPPYAQQRDYGNAKAIVQDWDALMQGVFSVAPVKHGAQVLVNLGLVHKDGEWWPYWDGWIQWMRDAGWRRFGWYVWDKKAALPGDWSGRLAPRHEWVFHFNRASVDAIKVESCATAGELISGPAPRGKDGKRKPMHGDGRSRNATRIRDSVCVVSKTSGGEHPAVMPVGLPRYFIESWPGESVYEPFSGSGTTIIAAETTGRACHAIEIDPAYVDVAVNRWQAFTGLTARLDGDGRTFDEVAGGR